MTDTTALPPSTSGDDAALASRNASAEGETRPPQVRPGSPMRRVLFMALAVWAFGVASDRDLRASAAFSGRLRAEKVASESAPHRLPLVPYSVALVAIGPSGATTIVLPEPAAEVVTSSLDAFSVEVDGPRLTIRVVATEPARRGADLFVTIGDVTYTLELAFDPKAPARTIEAWEGAGDGAGRMLSVTGAGTRGSSDAGAVMFVDAAALRLPPVVTAIGRLTRIELPTAPVNILLIDPDAFSVDLRGSDLYVAPSPDLATRKEDERRGRLQVFMNGGAVYDFDLRVGPAGRHHRAVVVRVARAVERRVLRRHAP